MEFVSKKQDGKHVEHYHKDCLKSQVKMVFPESSRHLGYASVREQEDVINGGAHNGQTASCFHANSNVKERIVYECSQECRDCRSRTKILLNCCLWKEERRNHDE